MFQGFLCPETDGSRSTASQSGPHIRISQNGCAKENFLDVFRLPVEDFL